VDVSRSVATPATLADDLGVTTGTSFTWLVSFLGMRPIHLSYSLLAFAMMLWPLGVTTAIEDLSSPNASDSPACQAEGPVLADKSGKPVWLSTDALLKRATRCAAPQMPPLLRQAELNGQVLVDILVDGRGQVQCVRVVSGHPLLTGSAVDAAKNWTFRPMRKNGKKVSFYGHLRFHFSTGAVPKNENPCTVAHW
jgi:TonB family protein